MNLYLNLKQEISGVKMTIILCAVCIPFIICKRELTVCGHNFIRTETLLIFRIDSHGCNDLHCFLGCDNL
jgi:hypothetical protein